MIDKDKLEQFGRAWSDIVRQGGDADRQRLLGDFVRNHPECELRAKVFFELQYRINLGQSVEAVAAYAKHVLSLPAAAGVVATDEVALREYVPALLRIGLALSNGDPGMRVAVGPADPRLAALAIEAFQRVEPLLQEQPPAFLAQFDLYVAHALQDCARPAEASERAHRALRRADAEVIGPDESVGVHNFWANLRKEATALIATAGSGG